MLPQWSSRTAVTGRSRSYSLKIWSPAAMGIGLVALACTLKVPVRQAGRVDRPEPGGVEGDRGDLLAAVEHLRIERESHAVGWMGPGVGSDAGHERTSGGGAGGHERATGDGRSHGDSFVRTAVQGRVRNRCTRTYPESEGPGYPVSGAASVLGRRCWDTQLRRAGSPAESSERCARRPSPAALGRTG